MRASVFKAVSVSILMGFLPVTAALADGQPAAAQDRGAPFSWTGFYAGAQIGGLANLSEINDPLGPSLFGNPNLASGAFAGGQVGYNYQSGIIVYGVEADVAFPQVEGTSTCSSLSGNFINSDCKTGIDAFGSVTARLGVALGAEGRSLIYGKAGAAWYTGSLDLATNDSETGRYGNPYTRGGNDLSQWGWTLGAGAEYALTGNWSVKAEYDYANFGNQSVTLLPSASLNPDGSIASTLPARQGSLSNDLHTFKLGLNYRFGDTADPREEPGRVSLKDTIVSPQNPFGFEIGGRYWYSWGRHKYDLGLNRTAPALSYSLISRLTYDDIDASTGEVTGRLSTPWNVFAKGFVGGGSITGGHMNDEDFNIEGDNESSPGVKERIPYTNTLSPKVSGDIPTYGTIDLGYDVWRGYTYRVGAYAGYNYYRETMGAYGVYQTANPNGPFGPNVGGPLSIDNPPIITQEATWQSLRLGAAAEFNIAPRLKLSADAAFLPYVSVDAQDVHYQGGSSVVSSVNPLSGHGVGTQLEAMLTYDVTDQWSVGVGARYWAMWTTDASFERSYDADNPVTYPLPQQNLKIETERAGVLGQVMYKFD